MSRLTRLKPSHSACYFGAGSTYALLSLIPNSEFLLLLSETRIKAPHTADVLTVSGNQEPHVRRDRCSCEKRICAHFR